MARYTINDIEYPSCTEILDDCTDKSDALMPWVAGEIIKYIRQNTNDQMNYVEIMDIVNLSRFKYRDTSKEALDNGSIVHGLIEDYIKFGIDKTAKREYNEQITSAFLAFLTWEKDNNVKWLESEIMVYSNNIYVAGRLDAVCMYQDKKYVVDFKSSKGFYDGYDLQVAAYSYLYNDMPDRKIEDQIKNCLILRLDKETGIPEDKDYSKDIDRKYQAFTKLVDYFYLYKNRRLKNNPRAKAKECS